MTANSEYVYVKGKERRERGMEGDNVSDKHVLGSFKLRLVMVWCRGVKRVRLRHELGDKIWR